MAQFELPQNAQTYINTVKDRSFDLISHKIWNGIRAIDLKRWFKNFDGEVEEYFASCILDALIFRSEEQLVAQARELFTKKLCAVLSGIGFDFKNYNDLTNLLKGPLNNQLRLVSVENKYERPGKSSNVILRIYKRRLGFNENWFITPVEVEREISNGINTFIFIDDFLGTGKQFDSMYKSYGFSLKLRTCNCIYAPLVAHSTGINLLQLNHSEIIVTSSENLNDDYDVFNHAFEDGINDPDGARKFYTQILAKNNFNNLLEENKYGFGNLSLVYTFSHSAPDNCLHIIWDNQNGWHPLVAK